MKLFEPIEIDGMKIKNRIVMPAGETNYHSPEGGVTERLLDFYRERAKGGIGFAVVGIASAEYRYTMTNSYPSLQKLSKSFIPTM